MKRYFDREDFITFLNLLEVGKPTSLYVETVHPEEEIDGDITECKFFRIKVCEEDVILYEHPYGAIGLIADGVQYDWTDCAEGVFDDLERDGEYRVFIKEK